MGATSRRKNKKRKPGLIYCYNSGWSPCFPIKILVETSFGSFREWSMNKFIGREFSSHCFGKPNMLPVHAARPSEFAGVVRIVKLGIQLSDL